MSLGIVSAGNLGEVITKELNKWEFLGLTWEEGYKDLDTLAANLETIQKIDGLESIRVYSPAVTSLLDKKPILKLSQGLPDVSITILVKEEYFRLPELSNVTLVVGDDIDILGE